MYQKMMKNRFMFLVILLLGCLLSTAGCRLRKERVYERKTPIFKINRLVFIGFKAALSPGDTPDVIRDPVSGAVFLAEPVPAPVVESMTDLLFKKLITAKKYDLVSPGQALNVISAIVDSDQQTGMQSALLLQKVGQQLKADAVLTGYIYRWQERIGTDYSVRTPASVAFDLLLIRPKSGAILWRGRFDKTQQALSDNLLDWITFSRSKGRWVTAKKLATFGLEDLLDPMLTNMEKRDEPNR